MTTHRLPNILSHAARRIHEASFATLALVAGIALPGLAQATTGCYRITAITTNPNSVYYTEPGSIAGPWVGALDTAGQNAYPMTIQITSFAPEGTQIGSGVAPLTDMGANGVGTYSPEQILFRCSPDSAGSMFEYYSTNGDNVTAGKTDVSALTGVPGTYSFPMPNIASRVTNLRNGEIVSRYWGARLLDDLDRDRQGWFLVKAKNFSSYRVDLYQCRSCGSRDSVNQPIAYVAFAGGASGNIINKGLYVGADHNTNYTGWYGTWPGSINPRTSLRVHTVANACAVLNTTPFVRFPSMTVAELERGDSRQLPITIEIKCQPGYRPEWSGTKAGQTAMGILIPPANAQSAIAAGLKTAGTGVRYLLSNGYGVDPTVAKGVGVELSRPNGVPVNFLTNRFTTGGEANDGWEPVLDDVRPIGGTPEWYYYSRTINATFKAFAPGQTPVTPGRYAASAEVVVQIQ